MKGLITAIGIPTLIVCVWLGSDGCRTTRNKFSKSGRQLHNTITLLNHDSESSRWLLDKNRVIIQRLKNNERGFRLIRSIAQGKKNASPILEEMEEKCEEHTYSGRCQRASYSGLHYSFGE